MSYLSYDFLEQNYSPTTVQKRAALFEAKASSPAQNISCLILRKTTPMLIEWFYSSRIATGCWKFAG
jgi:hypothetical protein